MLKHGIDNNEQRKVADLTVKDFINLFKKLQSDVLKELIPESDPESELMTTKQVAKFLLLSRQTIQEKKKKGLIKFFGPGRIQRTTKAECLRYLRENKTSIYSIKRAQEEEKRKEEAKKGNRKI